MKILTVVGARPQFIKTAPLSAEINTKVGCQEIVVHTGQHYDENMSDIFFHELGLKKPDHYLNVGSGSHGAQTASMLEKIESCVVAEKPDRVLVYGDTNSTLAGALVAAKLHIPVAHVEAGLRSFNRRMPEEINRVVTDHVSDYLFAPTEIAVENLLQEGRPKSAVFNVGDVMQDVAIIFGERAKANSTVLQSNKLTEKEFALVTIHRAENTDSLENLRWITRELLELSVHIPVVLPLHPRTKKALEDHGLHIALCSAKNILFLEPLGYLDMVRMEQAAKVIVTDSGGVQKEAFFQGTPCVTVREETEWKELVTYGWNRLCPPRGNQSLADLAISSNKGVHIDSLYGDGTAAKQIVDILLT
ncbi:UDP-N-acetylglucosamine 2-epimerase (non-hydrolyzing) [PVC group bacterium]|nr:UDP-N-acetylglucosamine 2-epimerase (non-hydrolyzing) [PVC group bacterium]